MIIFAAMLASTPALPWLDRAWIDRQVRLEMAIAATAAERPRPMRARAETGRKTLSSANDLRKSAGPRPIGM
jgi:hypothetical protein